MSEDLFPVDGLRVRPAAAGQWATAGGGRMSSRPPSAPPERLNRCPLFAKMAPGAADVVNPNLEDPVAPGDKAEARRHGWRC